MHLGGEMATKNRRREAARFISDRDPAEITADMLGKVKALKAAKLESYSRLIGEALRNDVREMLEDMAAQTSSDIEFIAGLLAASARHHTGGTTHFHLGDSELFDHTLASIGQISSESAPADVLRSLISDSASFLVKFDMVCHEYPGTLLEERFHELYARELGVKDRLQEMYDSMFAKDY